MYRYLKILCFIWRSIISDNVYVIFIFSSIFQKKKSSEDDRSNSTQNENFIFCLHKFVLVESGIGINIAINIISVCCKFSEKELSSTYRQFFFFFFAQNSIYTRLAHLHRAWLSFISHPHRGRLTRLSASIIIIVVLNLEYTENNANLLRFIVVSFHLSLSPSSRPFTIS